MNLVLLSEIKERIAIPGDDDSKDDILTTLIRSVSNRVERFLDRQIESKSTTEYFDVHKLAATFQLKAYPVTSVTGVYNDPLWSFSSAMSSSFYTVLGDQGQLVFNSEQALVPGRRALKIVYVGGMADTTEELLALYSDLSEAAMRQILNDFNRRKFAGATHVDGGGVGSISYEVDQGLLQSVREDIEKFRRYAY